MAMEGDDMTRSASAGLGDPCPDGGAVQTYFVQAVGGGPVKIGRTRKPMDERLRALQTGSPVKLRVIGVIEGDREGECHRKFAHDRLHGEWFTATDKLLKFIRLQASVPRGVILTERVPRAMGEMTAKDREPLPARYCEMIVDHEDAYDLITPAVSEDIDGCDEEDDCDCDSCRAWDALAYIAECDMIDRVGLNSDHRLIWLDIKDVNSGRREYMVEQLAGIAWDLDAVEWHLFASFWSIRWGKRQVNMATFQSVLAAEREQNEAAARQAINGMAT
jgi:hypothetical protein